MTTVLIIGRSQNVLDGIVDGLREHGYDVEATNRFDTVLDEYDVGGYDVLVFGGAVSPETKDLIGSRATQLNPRATLVDGLAGIAGVVVGQVLELSSDHTALASYDATLRSVRLEMPRAAHVTVEAFWGTFVPPEPVSSSVTVADGDFAPGRHDVRVPDRVPGSTSFAVVTVGDETTVLTGV